MKKIILITIMGVAIIMAVVVTLAIKHLPVRAPGSYFEPDSDSLRQVPKGIVLVSPTHFSFRPADMRQLHEDSSSVTRAMGRNVPLRNVIAEACDCAPSRVAMPPDAPRGGYDYVVTTGPEAREDLRAVIENKLGYTIHQETRVVDVLALKVQDPNLPGLTVSPDSEPSDETMKDGKPYLIHRSVSDIIDSLSQGLDQPVVDESGLTNCYDYSETWKPMKDDALTLTTVKQVLAGWGLRLEPSTAAIDMVVVEKGASPFAEPTADKAPVAMH